MVKGIAAVALGLLLFGMGHGTVLAQDAGNLATDDQGGTAYASDSYYLQTHTPGFLPSDSINSKVKSFSNYWWRAGSYVAYRVDNADAPTGAGTYVAMEDTSYTVSIGDYRTPEADNFDGLLDEVRVYGRALSATEVQALFTNP